MAPASAVPRPEAILPAQTESWYEKSCSHSPASREFSVANLRIDPDAYPECARGRKARTDRCPASRYECHALPARPKPPELTSPPPPIPFRAAILPAKCAKPRAEFRCSTTGPSRQLPPPAKDPATARLSLLLLMPRRVWRYWKARLPDCE